MEYKSSDIREKFLEFFQTKSHAIIPSASVVPENDPTVLFTTAGMHPLVPYLLGQPHSSGTRLANYQKCIRTWDIDEVGDNSHGTFFEMLGNWSFGDYFKEDSIAWSFEFLTSQNWLGLDPKKIAVSVFEWDEDAPVDEESSGIWQRAGMPKERISYLPKSENWWGPAGQTGPCGPDTEIFYWVGESDFPPEGSNVKTDEDNWMEIWNNVFMEYLKDEEWKFVKAKQKNVDTGMGLERITAILNGQKDVYSTDIFADIIQKIEETLWVKYEGENIASIRIIADHTRCGVVMVSDGIVPSNVDQWYILRRLLRRSVRQAYKLGFKWTFLSKIAEVIIWKLGRYYPNIKANKVVILDELSREEKQFSETLDKWLKEFDKLVKGFQIAFERSWKKIETIAGPKAFKLYDTYGFPLEMTKELASENNLSVDEVWFNKAFEEHQKLSRAGSEQKFKWGLADDSEATTALHSATHLMLAGLRKYLWDDVHQKGSNITAERLRFDFNYPEKVERDILDKVEDYVNEAIEKNCHVELSNMDKQEAMDSGVEGSFWEKYPDTVKVYTFQSESWDIYSRELCWGPHVESTMSMWRFRIKKEESSSRGVRRVKAVLEK